MIGRYAHSIMVGAFSLVIYIFNLVPAHVEKALYEQKLTSFFYLAYLYISHLHAHIFIG